MKKSHNAQTVAMDEPTKLAAFNASRIFKDLEPAAVKELAGLTAAVLFEKGATIFVDGDPAEYWYIVQKGRVKLYKGSPSGKNLTLTIATTGDTLNGLALSVQDYFMTAQAMTDLVVLRTGRKQFLEFVNRHPAVAIHMVAVLARRLTREYDRMVDVVGEGIERRMVHCLRVLAQKFGTRVSLTREELADFAGTTTETTIRVLSRLKQQGIIGTSAARGEIVIADLKKLEEYDPF